MVLRWLTVPGSCILCCWEAPLERSLLWVAADFCSNEQGGCFWAHWGAFSLSLGEI